jgi:hypothetical protein
MTTELKPGTPEYDEAYQKEIQRLEAEAKGGDKKDAKAHESNTSADDADPKGDAKADDGKTETAEDVKARLDKAERELQAAQKAIKDTQRWGHKNAEEVKKLKREAEDRKRHESLADDPVLKANPGLREAIEHVAKPKDDDAKPAPQEQWLSSISKAIPDVETLLADQAFFAKAKAKQAEYGPEWDDPFVAIRELSELKSAHLSEKRITVAVEQARKDFETKAKKRSAMEMPGGSGGKDTQDQTNEAEKYRTMSKEEFDKVRSRVMGY